MSYAASRSFKDFKRQLEVVTELIAIESRLSNPPLDSEIKASNGLKGGAAVLVVASFEAYLQSALEEYLEQISSRADEIKIELLPHIWSHNLHVSLSRAIGKGGPLHRVPEDKDSRIPNIIRACQSAVQNTLTVSAFSETEGNPNEATIKNLFKPLGVTNVFGKIKRGFDSRWGQPTAETFLQDKLLEIINRRNRVAHNADTRGISRQDLKESVRFLRHLAEALDRELKSRVRELVRKCPRRA